MVVVTGGRGFLGSHVAEAFAELGVSQRLLGSADGDLRDADVATRLVAGAEIVVHLAADVGGVGYLKAKGPEVFHNNLTMGLNVIEASRRAKVRRLLIAGTPCSYAPNAPLPLREESLSAGFPVGDTGLYATAKLVTSLAAKAMGDATGIDVATVIPSNLYGPGDHYEMDRAHVVAALIRKAVIARETNARFFEVWGDGSASRDLVYVSDVARTIASMALSDARFEGAAFNLSSDRETSIADLANEIAVVLGGGIQPWYLPDRPVGYQRRLMSSSRARASFQYTPVVGLADGLARTVASVYAKGLVPQWIDDWMANRPLSRSA
jgi:GDP-L-fucose synthase